jgi:hypothetical protein
MKRIPQIKAVKTIGETQLLVTFKNEIEKVYDCGHLLSRPEFHLLTIPAFFKAVRIDTGGYGISWSDNLDLSEYELWTNGRARVKGT